MHIGHRTTTWLCDKGAASTLTMNRLTPRWCRAHSRGARRSSCRPMCRWQHNKRPACAQAQQKSHSTQETCYRTHFHRRPTKRTVLLLFPPTQIRDALLSNGGTRTKKDHIPGTRSSAPPLRCLWIVVFLDVALFSLLSWSLRSNR